MIQQPNTTPEGGLIWMMVQVPGWFGRHKFKSFRIPAPAFPDPWAVVYRRGTSEELRVMGIDRQRSELHVVAMAANSDGKQSVIGWREFSWWANDTTVAPIEPPRGRPIDVQQLTADFLGLTLDEYYYRISRPTPLSWIKRLFGPSYRQLAVHAKPLA